MHEECRKWTLKYVQGEPEEADELEGEIVVGVKARLTQKNTGKTLLGTKLSTGSNLCGRQRQQHRPLTANTGMWPSMFTITVNQLVAFLT